MHALYSIPIFARFMAEHREKIRLDMLQANFVADDPCMYAICQGVPDNDDIWPELLSINCPSFDDHDIAIFGEIFAKQGPDGIKGPCRRSMLSAIRHPAAVEYLLSNPELIDPEEFEANPCALPFYEANPHMITNKRAITRNPAALPFLMNNQQFIDWSIIAGVWYEGFGARSWNKRTRDSDDEPQAKRTRA